MGRTSAFLFLAASSLLALTGCASNPSTKIPKATTSNGMMGQDHYLEITFLCTAALDQSNHPQNLPKEQAVEAQRLSDIFLTALIEYSEEDVSSIVKEYIAEQVSSENFLDIEAFVDAKKFCLEEAEKFDQLDLSKP